MSDPACSLRLGSGGSYVSPSRAPVRGEEAAGVTYKCCLQVSYGNCIAETFLGGPSRAVCACSPYRQRDGACVGVSLSMSYPSSHRDGLQAVLPAARHQPFSREGSQAYRGSSSCRLPREPGRNPTVPTKSLQFNISGFLTPPAPGKEGFRWGAGAQPALQDLNPALRGLVSSLLALPGQCL